MNIINDGKRLVNLFNIDDRKTQGILPKLIEKLIKATCNSNTHTCFPSGSAIFTTGFDGIIEEAPEDLRFVPGGRSIWELGFARDPERKIRDDYNKNETSINNSLKKDTTIVFVVGKIIGSDRKDELTKDLGTKTSFKKVIIYDANDLVNWLEEHSEISIWLLKEYQENIKEYGIKSVEDERNDIVCSTNPHLSPDIYLCGNEGNKDDLISIINSKDSGIISLSSKFYGIKHAYYFIIASIMQTKDYSLIDRCIIIDNPDTFISINSLSKNKIIILKYDYVKSNFNITGNNIIIFYCNSLYIEKSLNLIDRNRFIKYLQELNFSANDIEKYAVLSNYNPVSLKRLLSVFPIDRAPNRIKNKEKYNLIPIMLLGEINMNKSLSVASLTKILNKDLDDYMYSLDYLSELDDSPVFKYSGHYILQSRVECFDYVHIDTYLSIFKKTEELFKDLIFDGNDSIENETLIKDIVQGMALIIDKNSENQVHFDCLLDSVYSLIENKIEIWEKTGKYFPLLSELSPKAFLKFINKAIDEDAEFLKTYCNGQSGKIYKINNIVNVIKGLRACYSHETIVQDALETLINFFYNIDHSERMVIELTEIMSPLATMAGLTSITLKNKVLLLYKLISDRNSEIIEPVIVNLSKLNNNSLAITSNILYRKYQRKQIVCSYQEVYEAQEMAFQWCVSNDISVNKLAENVFESIYFNAYSTVEQQFNILYTKINKLDSETKEKIRLRALSLKNNVIKYHKGGNVQKCIPLFDKLINLLEPKDLYEKLNYILRNDYFPLDNLSDFDDENIIEKEDRLRQEIRKKTITTLLEVYGQEIIKKIIMDKNIHSYYIWKIIYDLSDDISRDIDNMFSFASEMGLNCYLSLLSADQLMWVYEKYKNQELIFKSLPFSYDVIHLIDGNANEKIFWLNKNYFRDNKIDISDVFEKFLEFNPYGIVDYFTFGDMPNYEKTIRLLKKIAIISNDEEYKSKKKDISYQVREIINKMDSMYSTDELSECEFNLLHIIYNQYEDFPLGIKKYFWNHPEDLSDFLLNIYNNFEKYERDSIGFSIFINTYIGLNKSVFIPVEYIVQQPENFINWVGKIIKKYETNKSNKDSKLLIKTIVNICSSCPRVFGETYWPSIHVADILEKLNKLDSNKEVNVTNFFVTSVLNKRGMRNVEDGAKEFALSYEYLQYANYYKITHPNVYKALIEISENYNQEGKRDKISYDLGKY